jgi:hypothetical protein
MPRESQQSNLPVRRDDDEREGSRELQRASSTHSATVNLRNPFDAILSGTRWRRAARWIGLLIFIIGALLLAYVFYEALRGFQRFAQPDYLSMQMRRVQGDGMAESIMAGVIALGTSFCACSICCCWACWVRSSPVVAFSSSWRRNRSSTKPSSA